MVARGEIYLCAFGQPTGHEAGFTRPALVVSHDSLNGFEVPVVLPITRTRRGYPTHVELDGVLGEVCYVQCELVTAVSAKRLGRKLGRIGIVELAEIEKILRRILVL